MGVIKGVMMEVRMEVMMGAMMVVIKRVCREGGRTGPCRTRPAAGGTCAGR
jgi:hypothetical protein